MPSKIRKRGENTYELAVTNGYDYYNKQIVYRKTVKAANDREAKKLYYEFESSVLQGNLTQTVKIKVGDFALQWYKEYCEPRLAGSTLRNYKRCLQQRIIPAIGHIDIRVLQPFHIIPFINGLLQTSSRLDGKTEDVNGQAAMYCYRVLSSMLAIAVKWGVIPANPCEKVDPPKIQKKIISSYNIQETQGLLSALDQVPIRERMMITLAVCTGMRLGELLALQWSDIDFMAETMQIVRSCQAIPHQGLSTKEPKNVSSIRCVTLPESTMQMLIQYKQWQDNEKMRMGNEWTEQGWIFSTEKGLLIHPSTLSHWFKRFLEEHELPQMPFHGLRHTSASLLLAAGAPIKNVSTRLGHSDIRTTGNIYAKSQQSADKEIAEKMDGILKKAPIEPGDK